jgi:transcriptional regulator with XRE-family HTH domain
MRFEEKLRREMLLKGFNQQRLARASGVSDSEVSRILAGKSQPGLENALKLARAVGVSLDYLADDSMDSDPKRAEPLDPWVSESLELVRELGVRDALQLLMAVRTIGREVALRRLFGLESASPVAEPGSDAGADATPGRSGEAPETPPTNHHGGPGGGKVSPRSTKR